MNYYLQKGKKDIVKSKVDKSIEYIWLSYLALGKLRLKKENHNKNII